MSPAQFFADARRVAVAILVALGVGFHMAFAFAAVMGSIALVSGKAHGRDVDGRYAQSQLREWFNGLQSSKGLCCSLADGKTVQDVDWDTDGNHYRVRLDGAWIDVPDDAVILEPNRAGVAVVWPTYYGGKTEIRCFIPGTGA